MTQERKTILITILILFFIALIGYLLLRSSNQNTEYQKALNEKQKQLHTDVITNQPTE